MSPISVDPIYILLLCAEKSLVPTQIDHLIGFLIILAPKINEPLFYLH